MSVPLTPVRFLNRAAELFGDRVGVISGDHQFTYGEFTDRCRRLAGALAAAGIEKGDRVGFLSFNNHQLLEGYYGAPLARAAVMPLNVRLAPFEIRAILKHSGARILFYEPDFDCLVDGFRADCPEIMRFVRLDEEYETFISDASPADPGCADIDEESMAELFYTSGSTGIPKGVMLSHRAIYLHALNVATVYEQPETMIDLHTIPLFHANGWGHAHVDVMLGIKQVMVRRFDPVCVLELIQRHRATDMSVVPTMANALLNVPNFADFDVSSMRSIQLGGAASSPELVGRLERAFQCTAYAGYGLTETSPVLCIARADPQMHFSSDEERYTVQAMTGRPIPGVDLRVADPHGSEVPRDGKSVGEIVVRADHLMSGYYRDPEGTAAVMKEGWFHTGDMAVWNANGYVLIVDRKKEIIVSGGENISSIEVERAIAAHPEVFECAVVSAPDDKWGEVPAAIVVRKPGCQVSAEELCRFLEGRLGKFKMPRIVDFESEPLPKTGTGKIRKMVLRERYWTGKESRVGK